MIATLQSTDPDNDHCPCCGLRLRDGNKEIARLRAQRDQLLAALKQIAIGCNHIATYRTDRWPSYGTEPADALEKLGASQEYDMWCCWNAMMCARDAVTLRAAER